MKKDRSISATVVEECFRLVGVKKKMCDKERYEKFMSDLKREEYKIPTFLFKSSVEIKKYLNKKVYILNKKEDTSYVILYLHGGAYVNEPLITHWQYVDHLAQAVNAEIIFPIYPLIPDYTYKDSFELLDALYKDILKLNKTIIFMGDSAGGGLALSYNEYLYEKNIERPSKLVLFSPWVDVSMENTEMIKYEEEDPSLSKYGLIELGKLWAGDVSTKDYKVSPIYGNLKSIKKALVFVGTRELLYPDIKKLEEETKKLNIDCEVVIGENMNHVYPLYPIKEAKEAYEKVEEFIKNKE